MSTTGFATFGRSCAPDAGGHDDDDRSMANSPDSPDSRTRSRYTKRVECWQKEEYCHTTSSRLTARGRRAAVDDTFTEQELGWKAWQGIFGPMMDADLSETVDSRLRRLRRLRPSSSDTTGFTARSSRDVSPASSQGYHTRGLDLGSAVLDSTFQRAKGCISVLSSVAAMSRTPPSASGIEWKSGCQGGCEILTFSASGGELSKDADERCCR